MPADPRSHAVEKEFYLRSFRHRAMVLALGGGAAAAPVMTVVEELAHHGVLVVVVGLRAPTGIRSVGMSRADLSGRSPRMQQLVGELLEHGRVFARRPRSSRAAALVFARGLASRLGANKLVLADERGGLPGAAGAASFVSSRSLARRSLVARRRGRWSRRELDEVLAALRAGVQSVNLVSPSALAQELFTYEGAGTLVTEREYCSVGRLGVEHFGEAARLLARGEREGFLLARSEDERRRLLLDGFGAWFGSGPLAGVCGLETELYRRQRLGEVAGFYTITRFKGHGVGVRIIEHLARVGRRQGLRGLFACTSSERAAEFFVRNGFAETAPSDIPAVKWKARGNVGARSRPRVFLRALAAQQ